MTASRIASIGEQEADSTGFAKRIRHGLPQIELFAANHRPKAMRHAGDAVIVIGHHVHGDDELLQRAPKLRWIQSLTTGTVAILKLASLRHDVMVGATDNSALGSCEVHREASGHALERTAT